MDYIVALVLSISLKLSRMHESHSTCLPGTITSSYKAVTREYLLQYGCLIQATGILRFIPSVYNANAMSTILTIMSIIFVPIFGKWN